MTEKKEKNEVLMKIGEQVLDHWYYFVIAFVLVFALVYFNKYNQVVDLYNICANDYNILLNQSRYFIGLP